MNREGIKDWLLPVLARIRTRPGAFLGDERVETLEALIFGYVCAREDLGVSGMSSHDAQILEQFASRW